MSAIIERHKRAAARAAVKSALSIGALARPDRCTECGTVGDVEAHHPDYEPAAWLDVVWLCRCCHNGVHHPLRVERRYTARHAVQTADPLLPILTRLFDGSGLSNAEIARRVAVDPAQITRYRAGKQRPSLSVLRALLDALDAPSSACADAERAWLDLQARPRHDGPAEAA